MPSMHVSNWATILRSISLCAFSRFGVTASISSMNRRQGANCAASSKISRTFFSDSPDMPDTIDGADTDMNGIPISPAIAFANKVFPQPGGPCNNTPLYNQQEEQHQEILTVEAKPQCASIPPGVSMASLSSLAPPKCNPRHHRDWPV